MNGLNLDEQALLKQYGTAKQLQIENLLRQYGTSLKDVREMYPQLTTAIAQKKLTTTFPTQPLFFGAAEAQEMGLGLEEGWMLKMTPMEGNGGFTSSLITPQKWEITENDLYISPTGEQYSKADLEALMAVPTGLEGLAPITGPMTTENLTEEGQALYGEYQEAGGELGVGDWINLRESQQLETEQIFGAVFPERDISEIISYIETNAEGFLADIREIGRTPETEALLRSIIPEITEADFQEIFATTVVPEYVPESWLKDRAWDPFLAMAANVAHGLGGMSLSVFPSVIEGFGSALKEFGYDILSIPAYVGAFLGAVAEGKPIGEATEIAKAIGEHAVSPITMPVDQVISQLLPNIQKIAEQKFTQLVEEREVWEQEHPELIPPPEYLENPFENTELFKDPGYYLYSISSALPYSVAVMGTLVAVSAIATPAAGIPAALMVAAGPEATSMTQELIELGVPFEEAAQMGMLYGLSAGTIETVSDLPFIGLIFKPVGLAMKPIWNTIFRGVANRLAKRVLTGLLITQVEGIEEIMTQVIHNAILKHYDGTVEILSDLSHVYIQGVIASLPFGAIGGYASFNTFHDKLSPEMRQKYDLLVTEFENAGLTQQQAQVQAANELVRAPEGEAELSQAIEAAQEEYREEHPLPPPVEPGVAEEVLRDIEVAEEITRKVTPVTPEVTRAEFIKTYPYRDTTLEGELKTIKESGELGIEKGLITRKQLNAKIKEFNEVIDRTYQAVQAEKAVVPTAEAKEPWQMTREEFFTEGKNRAELYKKGLAPPYTGGYDTQTHRKAIRQALSEGKPVPAEVLKDYPDLVPETGKIIPETGMPEETDPATIQEIKNSIAEGEMILKSGKSVTGRKMSPEELGAVQRSVDKARAKIEPTVPKAEAVPEAEKKGKLYFTLKKAQALTRLVPTNLTDKQLQEAYVKVRDYIRYIDAPDMKRLSEGGYYVSAVTDTTTGLAPKDIWLRQNLGTTLDELTAERNKRMGRVVPETAVGMPEAGLQPPLIEGVPAKEVRPEARGKLVQSRLDDYLRLREYNKERVSDRISEIKKALETKGKLPRELGLKGNLRLELARLEALQEVETIETVEELDHLIRQVVDEIGLRSMPGRGEPARKGIDLARHPRKPGLFPEYTTKQLDEIIKIYEQARQTLSPEVVAVSPIKAVDIPIDVPALTSTQLTPRQIERTIELFKEAVAAPNADLQRAAALELRKHVFAQRAKSASESAETMIAEGMNPEEAIKVAEQQFMTGKLPDVTTDYFNDLTQEMRNVLFGKVYNYWKDKSWPELISTFEALTNALAGRSIPRVKGIGSKYFPDGGSAWDRLARVFIGEPELLEALDQGKSLSNIIEGIYLETGRGSVSLDQGTIEWLKSLATISKEDRILLEKPLSEISEVDVRRVAEGWFYQRRQELQTLLKDGVINEDQYKLQLAIAKDKVFPHKPISPAVSYPEGMFDQLPLLTLREKDTIVRTLKSTGMTLIDIGNFLRANKASVDMSFWRQEKALTPGNPGCFYRANVEAFKGLVSQASAEANWEWVKRRPSYPYYVEMERRTGQDFLRMLEAPKGTAQWQAAEEFGYLTQERPIPRFTARIPWIKWSGRAFVVGTNTMNILVYDKCLEATLRRADMIATGKITLEEGEGFSMQQEMDDYGKAIAWMTHRASLGRAKTLAPEVSAIFFAPRSKLGRFLTPKLLIDSNPRVRAFAWKNLSLFVGTISSLVMLGYWLGLWDVERDPRNAEFMSIRIGNMRIDPWAGYRQFLVLYTRLTAGTGVSSVTGQEYEVNPIAALTTFLRTSLSPLTSILLNFWTGKNFLGEEVDIANPRQWLEQIAPFSVQDIWEAYEDDWQNGLIAILPAIFGEGVQTYTGDWRENWEKIGLPKYPENTGYGIDEPIYDIADFWADTATQFRGVDPASLTESKGYPEYVRSIAQTLQIIEQIELLPNKRLASLNADPEEGTTFKQYYEMWQERQRIVASGDDEALKEFDADERTRNAYLGNMTQAQYALLMEYHSLPESEKAEFLGRHPGLYSNPREDWLRSHPEENALLALWGKAKIYSQAALEKLPSLAQSLGIPESALIERDLDAVAQLKLKHDELFELLDVYGGLDDEIKDADGLTARDRAIQELYENNPDFRDDMRRIDALRQGTEDNPTPEDIVEGWVERGIIVDEYGAGSAEAKLWLIDNREAHQWALDTALLSDDGTDWNEPILRLLVQYRDDFGLYGAYGDISSDNYIENDDQRAEARRRLLFDDQGLTSFGRAYYTREASSQGYSEGSWPSFVEYSQLPIWGSWRERFLLDNLGFYKEYTNPEIGNHPLVDETKVRPINRDKIYQQFYDEFQAWDETGGMSPKAIKLMRDGLDEEEKGGMTFKEARYSIDAYDADFPENLIDDYVDWYSTIQFLKDYGDDWWLMEHMDFYNKLLDLGIWTEPRDFSKVPTREVYALYQTYQSLPSGNPRYDFRAKHPDLDAWLVLKFGYKPIEGRGEAGAPATPWEEAAQVAQFQELFK